MLERIIVNCLVQRLERKGPDFHDHQFGFRSERLTTKVIFRIRALTRMVVQNQGGVVWLLIWT